MDRETQAAFSVIELQLRRIAYALEMNVAAKVTSNVFQYRCTVCDCTLMVGTEKRCPVCGTLLKGGDNDRSEAG